MHEEDVDVAFVEVLLQQRVVEVLALPVAEDDEHALGRTGAVEVVGSDVAERAVVGRKVLGPRRRRPLDADRVADHRLVDVGVERREQVWEHAVGQRGDAERDVGDSVAEPQRELLRALQAVGRAGAAAREHRARDVEEDVDLRVRAACVTTRARDDRLGGRDPEERRDHGQRGGNAQARAQRRQRQPDPLRHATGAQLEQRVRTERKNDGERDERAERRQERHGGT